MYAFNYLRHIPRSSNYTYDRSYFCNLFNIFTIKKRKFCLFSEVFFHTTHVNHSKHCNLIFSRDNLRVFLLSIVSIFIFMRCCTGSILCRSHCPKQCMITFYFHCSGCICIRCTNYATKTNGFISCCKDKKCVNM